MPFALFLLVFFGNVSFAEVDYDAECKPTPYDDRRAADKIAFAPSPSLAVKLSSEKNGLSWDVKVTEAGKVSGGTHDGGALWVGRFGSRMPDDDENDDPTEVTVARFYKFAKRLVYLPKLSDTKIPEALRKAVADRMRLTLETDESYTTPLFETPLRFISVGSACLGFKDTLAEWSPKGSKKVGEHARYGEIYKSSSAYFVIALPDKTALRYYYLPPLRLATMNGAGKGIFDCFRTAENGETAELPELVNYQTVDERQLVKVDSLSNLGDVYRRRRSSDPSYAEYRSLAEDRRNERGDSFKPLTKTQFSEKLSSFVWKTPLGEWIECKNTQLHLSPE